MKRRAGLAALLAACTAPAIGRNLRVGPDQRLHEVVAAAHDGDEVELDDTEHRGQTAVITQRRLTLRGRGPHTVLHADGAHAEGKALLVVRGGDVRIEGIEFRGTRVPAGNGCGIRFEQGRLAVADCGFFDNEMGLLTANVAAAELTVERCAFGQAPRHDGPLHHLLYVGRIGSLQLSDSRFSGGYRGHLVKSRAAVNHIRCNLLLDGPAGEASYEIDLPNGGRAWVQGNVIGQGPQPRNGVLLAFGAEGQPHADSHLVLTHNHFINDAGAPAAFVRHWAERLPPQATVQIEHNLFVGPAIDGSWGRPADGNVLLHTSD